MKRLASTLLVAYTFSLPLSACGQPNDQPTPTPSTPVSASPFAQTSPTPEESPALTSPMDDETFEEAKRVTTELVTAVTWATDPVQGGYIPEEVYTHTADPYQSWLIADLTENPVNEPTLEAMHTDQWEYFRGYNPDAPSDLIIVLCIPPETVEGESQHGRLEHQTTSIAYTYVLERTDTSLVVVHGIEEIRDSCEFS